jgi:hypothetical protein
VLNPGTYLGGLHLGGNVSVRLNPGIYYLKGGGFSVSSQASVSGSGVLIVNAPGSASDTINLSGQGSVALTAIAGLTGSMAAYNGVVLMQAPSSKLPLSLSGQSVLALTGTVYAPGALVNLKQYGGLTVASDFAHGVAGQVIAADLNDSGNGVVTFNLSAPAPGGSSLALGAQSALGANTDPAGLGSLSVGGGGVNGPAILTDGRLLDEVAAALAADSQDRITGAAQHRGAAVVR